ncbi:MAG: Fe(2+)-trafficking protein [Planctomycetes bacterium]|nr:Fe(2+)-trafficking protein [Planctomycetota bacterium]
MDLDQRIAQFENMAAEDADNDMAHFSLGGAYLQAGRHAEAAASLQRCLKLNPEMSKAYQLAGEALIGSGQEDAAAELLLKGYEIASGKGDVMPRDAMAELLKKLGRELPTTVIEPAPAATAAAADGDGFICKASGRPGTQLPESPMRGALGQWIYENISAEMWKTWIGQGTKVINELRLDFSREEDQKVYDQYMCEFLGIDEAQYNELTAKV